ncbi:hypothetical protein Q2K19_05630 [Micromonospora soli]|uniref:hypothetical protein n=1 Tax=Micromonospora sp. NBRC 110009 TaxID=3061627 RepID=UPI0026731A77|nr:hypothetical protein [Micromonospora sp. NBRC 110009]WKT99970.1 hypothetical protein Q2K19_05630 [Micromonospora sp. NBRC 110009]
MPDLPSVHPPFRWDLVTPANLGTLLDGCGEPNLPYLDDLVECAAKVVARSGGGDLVFVGRSADSLFDLLSGVFADDERRGRLHRLAFSARFPLGRLPHRELTAARELLRGVGLTPHRLARAAEPVALVDLVYEGGTFGNLFHLLRRWVDEEREPWDVVRRKLRFVGVTARRKTSPHAFRWQQEAEWTRELPTPAVVNVSLPAWWSYFADQQRKLTRSFRLAEWTAEEGAGPGHDEETRAALAEAVSLVAYGREPSTRRRVAALMATEPAYAHRWLRSLVGRL